jgi:hypothetical protein
MTSESKILLRCDGFMYQAASGSCVPVVAEPGDDTSVASFNVLRNKISNCVKKMLS